MEDVLTCGFLILQGFAFRFFMGSKRKMQSLDTFEILSAKCILNSTFMKNTAEEYNSGPQEETASPTAPYEQKG